MKAWTWYFNMTNMSMEVNAWIRSSCWRSLYLQTSRAVGYNICYVLKWAAVHVVSEELTSLAIKRKTITSRMALDTEKWDGNGCFERGNILMCQCLKRLSVNPSLHRHRNARELARPFPLVLYYVLSRYVAALIFFKWLFVARWLAVSFLVTFTAKIVRCYWQ